MCAPERVRNDAVDEPLPEHVLRRKLQGLRRFHLVLPIPPQDGGAGFRADDAVPRVFQHHDAVADADAERAAGRPFADDEAQDGDLQLAHFDEVTRNRLALSTLLGFEAREGPRRVDEGDYGPVELLS